MRPPIHTPAPSPALRACVQGLFISVALLSGCGGSGDSTPTPAPPTVGQPNPPAPTPPAPPAPTPPAPTPPAPTPPAPTPPAPPAPTPPTPTSPAPPIPAGDHRVYYFSDCQDGFQVGCQQGNNNLDGLTMGTAKRDLSTTATFNVNTLPAGTQLKFARGGAWANFSVQLVNPNATPTEPLVFDAYTPSWGDDTARPLLKSAPTASYAFEFREYRAADNPLQLHGGYTIRNLKLDGQQTRYDWSADHRGRAFNVGGMARNVTVESMEITGFAFAMVSAQTYVGDRVTQEIPYLTLRNNYIHRNTAMGFLGEAQYLEISGNTFEANNMAPYRAPNEYISPFNHAIYLSGHAHDGVIRNNTFINNSVSAENDEGIPMCVGGNVTAHGQWTNLVIEGNTITQTLSNTSCIGFSITPGYPDLPEFFRGLVLRNNTVVNLGQAISVGAAINPVIQGNLLINLTARPMNGIALAAHVDTPGEAGDAIDVGAILLDNTLCTLYATHTAGQFEYRNELLTIAMRNSTDLTAISDASGGNVTQTDAAATTGRCAR